MKITYILFGTLFIGAFAPCDVLPQWPELASYTIKKIFDPVESAETVAVRLECYGGDETYSVYPIIEEPVLLSDHMPNQSIWVYVSHGDSVTFVVEGFNPDNPPVCSVRELAFGYSATGQSEGDGCYNQPERQGQYDCLIINEPNEATFNVTKVWFDGRQEEVDVELVCNGSLMDGPTSTSGPEATLTAYKFDTFGFPGNYYELPSEDYDPNRTGGSTCSVEEVGVTGGYVPSYSGDCIDVIVEDGGEYYCTVTNTPYFYPIDIKFCSNPNAFNCKNKGVLPVTIFGTEDFPVADIDVSTMRLCTEDLTACTNAPRDYSIADRGNPESDLGAAICAIDPATGSELNYLNPDLFDDMDVAFEAREIQDMLGTFCADFKGATSDPLVIIGKTWNGTEIFSAPVPNVGIDQLWKANR